MNRSGPVGRGLRFAASGGFAGIDPDIVDQLLRHAAALADQVIADPAASAGLKSDARGLLVELDEDAGLRFDGPTPADDGPRSGADGVNPSRR